MPLQFRLTHKINSVAAVGIIGVLTLGAIFIAGNASQDVARVEDEQARAFGDSNAMLQIALLEQRRAEKNFLIRKDEQYLAPFQQSGKVAAASLAELIRQTEASGPADLLGKLKFIKSGIEEYERLFAHLSAAVIKLGLKEDLGLEGN